MKTSQHPSSGGVLVVVLVVVLVIGAVTAGWLAIMTTELNYTDQFSIASQRRIAFGNATGLARQYILMNVLTKNLSGVAPTPTPVQANAGGGWGSISFNLPTAPPLSAIQKATINHFNPGNGDSYTQDITVTMTAGTSPNLVSISRLLQVKSRSSLLSGTVLALNQPGNTISGSVTCSGQALLWLPTGNYALSADAVAVPSQPSWNILPSNFPFPPLTGSEVAGVAAYDGSLNVVANSSTVNSLTIMAQISTADPPAEVLSVNGSVTSSKNGAASDGAGNVTIDLHNEALGNVVLTGGVTHLTLTGQTSSGERLAADGYAAILILVNQATPIATDLTTVTCLNSNTRKLVLAIKNPASSTVAFSFPQGGTGTWRSLITLENTPATFNFNGATETLYGGIQSNRNLTISSGALSIYPETSPKLLERLADRDAWIEAYTP